MNPFVDRLQVENFACVKSVDVSLTPLHAFIGPNDSGKSTLLRAIMYLCARVSGLTYHTGYVGPQPSASIVTAHTGPNRWAQFADGVGKRSENDGTVGLAQLVRLEPDALRQPCRLIPRGAAVRFENERGVGLAGILDVMNSRHPERFLALRARFVELFAGVERLEMQNHGESQKVIGVTLIGGEQIGPEAMSEGMLYWLAFKALQYGTKPGILLLEEPENGLHPARIREVMSLLREISAETQVLIATHSPLVVNELKPDEVTIITRTGEQGTIATPMTKTTNFEQRRQVYALGELWLSYADGVLESELVGADDVEDTKAAG